MGKANRQRSRAPEAGYDGTQTFDADVRLSLARCEKRSMRARPGTFEWRYNRPPKDKRGVFGAILLAGSHFAILWERAGTANISTPEWGKAGASDWRGLPDGSAAAMDELKAAMRELGKMATSRLSDYCVMGMTTAEIARKHGSVDRDMAAVLEHDLKACAHHFRFLDRQAA